MIKKEPPERVKRLLSRTNKPHIYREGKVWSLWFTPTTNMFLVSEAMRFGYRLNHKLTAEQPPAAAVMSYTGQRGLI